MFISEEKLRNESKQVRIVIYLVVGTLAALNSNAESRIEAARVVRRLSS